MTVKERMKSIGQKICRRQEVKMGDLETPLKRCLNTFELTSIGLSTLLSSMFVTIVVSLKEDYGSGIMLNYILGGSAAALAACAFAEMGSMFPKAGSGYMYVAMTLGELWGFFVGWNMVLEYAFGGAAMARCLTSNLFAVIENPNSTINLNTNLTILGQEVHFETGCVVLVLTILVAIGVQLTSIVNCIVNFSGLGLVIAVVIICFINGNVENWKAHGSSVFYPGSLVGAGIGLRSGFFSYLGFESLTVSSEESKDPKKSIPLALMLTILIATLIYIITSLAVTYLTPTYEFGQSIALSKLFFENDFFATAIVIGLAAVFTCCTTLIMCLYAFGRVLYAMASDGLLFKPLSYINRKTQTPLIAVVVSGVFFALISTFVKLEMLMEAATVGTVVNYISVNIAVILLRFESNIKEDNPDIQATKSGQIPNGSSNGIETYRPQAGMRKTWVEQNRFFDKFWPDIRPSIGVIFMVFFMVLLVVIEAVATSVNMFTSAWNAAVAIPCSIVIVLLLIHLFLYEQNAPGEGTFRIPLMPLIPAVSIFVNLIIIAFLSYPAWIWLAGWGALGLLIYFTYGIRHSINNDELGTPLLDENMSMDQTSNYGSNQNTDNKEEQLKK